ncbi:hypothetical protein FE904_13045 [Chryseobacterium indologenes]|uniref:Trimeric autotransporter adhesin YadA-like head domain-containing protein n=3 Tax=Chryseobacterium TaxID=59732 RepID=A0A3G6T7L3_9FLAO|nr:hypothetical protein EG347_20405 [Chryseobacterium sp. G0186]AZB25291.1 hypothetical protein EG339_12230 [Chryseobacterium bernardetii]EFK35923.1 hypothetical protein HMPREF0204_14992 [Chryseobacterium gleum ATCC 35910]EJC8060722.1 hypothetical protein [Elizabethkingia anophelis]QQY31638.1 hypothetical protein I6I60_22740 [Chryseobacterium gleum]TLX25198.1 hypothetical protein FE904_13045 [Chryseobacterium indologenes]
MNLNKNNNKMKTLIYLFLSFFGIAVHAQVGINTQTPEATLEVVGKPNDTNHYDGIIPPRITGEQLATKTYSTAKKGTIVFVTLPATNLVGQVIHITKSGLYYFDGSAWIPFIQEDPLNNVALRGNSSTVELVVKSNLHLDFDSKENYTLGNSRSQITGEYNSIVATDSKITSGKGNSASFYAMSQGEITGKLNYGAGVSALNGIANGIISGNRNIGIGAGAMSYITSGNDNISIGYLSGTGNRTGSNNVFIGVGAGSPASGNRSVSNKLAIHSTPVTTSSTNFWDSITNNYTDYKFALISGDFSERWLNINGKLSVTPSQMPNADNDSSYTKRVVAKSDGSFGFATELIPQPPPVGTYVLKSVNGVANWEAL